MGDALPRCIEAANTIGATGVFLDSLDDASTDLYRRLGFVEDPRETGAPADGPRPMILPMRVLLVTRSDYIDSSVRYEARVAPPRRFRLSVDHAF